MRVARPALADVVRGVGRARDVVVVEDAVLRALGVDAVALDVPGRHVRRAVAVGADEIERVAAEVVRRQVQDRDPVGPHQDPVLALVFSVQDDAVPVGAADRDVVLRRGDDVAAGIGAGREQDRVARLRPRDRELQRAGVLGNADLDRRRGGARAAGEGNERRRQRREHSPASNPPGPHACPSTPASWPAVPR